MGEITTLRKLQVAEFKILLEFKRICELHDLKYFLIGGTLLGAVRHHGFIPWDDDIDVGMLREDYQKFLEICPSELSDEYFLQTTDSDSGYAYVFAKIRLNGTEFRETLNEHVLKHNGIYLDIFPFDNAPPTKLMQKVWSVATPPIERICTYKYDYIMPKSRNIVIICYRLFCKWASKIISKQHILEVRDRCLYKYTGKITGYIVNWPFKITPLVFFEETTMMEFEGFSFPAPARYHDYLTLFYGDYMQIPPENKRPKHSPYEPDFGKYAYIKTLDDVLPKKE